MQAARSAMYLYTTSVRQLQLSYTAASDVRPRRWFSCCYWSKVALCFNAVAKQKLAYLAPPVPVGTLGSSLTPERTISRSVFSLFSCTVGSRQVFLCNVLLCVTGTVVKVVLWSRGDSPDEARLKQTPYLFQPH